MGLHVCRWNTDMLLSHGKQERLIMITRWPFDDQHVAWRSCEVHAGVLLSEPSLSAFPAVLVLATGDCKLQMRESPAPEWSTPGAR